MPFPALLQAASATAVVAPGPSLGEWIAYTVAAIGIVGAIYRLGMNTADTRNLKSSVTGALASMDKKLDAIAQHIDGSQAQRVDDAEWKGDINSRLGTVEREMGEVRESVHKARTAAAAAQAVAEATDRRIGAPDRRQP